MDGGDAVGAALVAVAVGRAWQGGVARNHGALFPLAKMRAALAAAAIASSASWQMRTRARHEDESMHGQADAQVQGVSISLPVAMQMHMHTAMQMHICASHAGKSVCQVQS